MFYCDGLWTAYELCLMNVDSWNWRNRSGIIFYYFHLSKHVIFLILLTIRCIIWKLFCSKTNYFQILPWNSENDFHLWREPHFYTKYHYSSPMTHIPSQKTHPWAPSIQVIPLILFFLYHQRSYLSTKLLNSWWHVLFLSW